MRSPSITLTRRRLLAGASTILLGGCVSAGRTPPPGPHDWPLLGGDPGRTGFAPDASPPDSEPDVAWERSPDPASGFSPIVGEGTLYYQTSDALYVLDPATGDGPEVATHGAFEGTGPPAFARSEAYNDGMYLVPYGGEIAGYPAAPDTWPSSIPNDGRDRMRWSSVGDTPAVGDHPVDSGRRPDAQPIPVGDVVVFESGGPRADRLTVVDVDDGSQVWTHPIGRSFDDVDRHAIRPARSVVDVERELVVTAFRASAGFRGGLEARRLGDGGVEWNARLGDAKQSIATSRGTVFVAVHQSNSETSTVIAVDAKNGSVRWRRPVPVTRRHGIAVDDMHCYHVGMKQSDEADADDDDGPLHVAAIARSDGRLVWKQTVGTASSFGFAEANLGPTVGGDVVLAPGGESLYAFDAQSGERLWQFSRTVPTSGGSRSPRRPMTPAIPVGNRIVLAMTLALYGLEEA